MSVQLLAPAPTRTESAVPKAPSRTAGPGAPADDFAAVLGSEMVSREADSGAPTAGSRTTTQDASPDATDRAGDSPAARAKAALAPSAPPADDGASSMPCLLYT